MEIIDEFECNIPYWAVRPIQYRDYSDINEENERMLQIWMRTLKRDNATWDIVFTSDTKQCDTHPAFGYPCATVKARVVYYAKQ